MPRSSNQKLKLLMLAEIFKKESSADRPLSLADLIERLNANGIEAERKSLYSDIETLSNFGIVIEKTGNSKSTAYYLSNPDFELHELKLLADAVACSKFITEKKSRELIEKLGQLTNNHDAGELKRNVIVSDRIKNANEQIYYNIDTVQRAIKLNRKIKFRYFDYDHKKNKRYHNGGDFSEVSPYALCWREENYYLVGYYPKYDAVTNFRVDKMETVTILNDEKRLPQPKSFNLNEYTKKRFGMFSGRDERITLKVHNSLSSVIFDRFGKNITVSIEDEDHFTINQPVTVSNILFGWIIQFGDKIEIVSPESVRDEFKNHIRTVMDMYK